MERLTRKRECLASPLNLEAERKQLTSTEDILSSCQGELDRLSEHESRGSPTVLNIQHETLAVEVCLRS